MSASIKDVAAAAGVSVGTVSNVLNRPEKVSPATAERVHATIEELGFVRNDAARQLRAGRSRSVGLIVLDTANPFFAEVARGAEERADAEGLSVLLGNSGQDGARENAYLDLFREQRVRGVLLTPSDVSAPGITQSGLPLVLDDVEGGYLATRHLLERGRRRLAFVGGPIAVRQVAARLDGARRALAEVPDAHLEIIEKPALTVLAGRQVGEEFAARRPEDRPDAAFCANDLLAAGVLQGSAILGTIRVPSDLAIIGYDDIDFVQSTVVPLSSVRQPAREIGATAIGVLLESFDDPAAAPRRVRFRPELVVRASTGG